MTDSDKLEDEYDQLQALGAGSEELLELWEAIEQARADEWAQIQAGDTTFTLGLEARGTT